MSVVSQQTALAFPAMQPGLPRVKAGELGALAVCGANRNELLPDLPTMREAMNPGFMLEAWYGLLAPADTAPEIIAKLNAKTVDTLPDPLRASRWRRAATRWSAARRLSLPLLSGKTSSGGLTVGSFAVEKTPPAALTAASPSTRVVLQPHRSVQDQTRHNRPDRFRWPIGSWRHRHNGLAAPDVVIAGTTGTDCVGFHNRLSIPRSTY